MVFACGCGNKHIYYFRLNFNSINMKVGDSIDISTLKFNTNLPNFEHMYIQASDDEIIILDNLLITGKKAGETEILINTVYNGKTYFCKLYIIVENKVDDNEIDTLSFSLQKYDDYKEEINIYIIDIFKKESEFYNFNFNFINLEKDALIFYDKSGCCIEIWYLKDKSFSIKVVDNNNSNNFLVINIE